MTGKILEFNRETNKGTIVSASGNKYHFHISDFKVEDSYPKKNLYVDFMLEEEKAIFIYPSDTQSKSSPKEQKMRSSIYGKVSFIFALVGVAAFVYFAYNSKTVTQGYFYTIPPLFAILTGHFAKKSFLSTLGLILGYLVAMLYIIVIVVGSFLS